MRIEVKQSAAWQTWSDLSDEPKPSRGVLDISPRTGYWTDDGTQWVSEPGRPADLYIFAWHPITGPDNVDHRDLAQWLFYVVPEAEPPADQNTIRQTVLARCWPERRFSQLQSTVGKLVGELAPGHKD